MWLKLPWFSHPEILTLLSVLTVTCERAAFPRWWLVWSSYSVNGWIYLPPPPPPQMSPAVMCNWSSPESDGSLQNEIDWQIFQSQPQHFSLEFCFRYVLPYWHTYDTTWIYVLLLLLLVFSVCILERKKNHVIILACALLFNMTSTTYLHFSFYFTLD